MYSGRMKRVGVFSGLVSTAQEKEVAWDQRVARRSARTGMRRLSEGVSQMQADEPHSSPTIIPSRNSL